MNMNDLKLVADYMYTVMLNTYNMLLNDAGIIGIGMIFIFVAIRVVNIIKRFFI